MLWATRKTKDDEEALERYLETTREENAESYVLPLELLVDVSFYITDQDGMQVVHADKTDKVSTKQILYFHGGFM